MRGNSSLSVRHCEFGDKQSSPHHHSSLRGGVPTKQSSQLIRLLFLTGLLRPHSGLAMTIVITVCHSGRGADETVQSIDFAAFF